MRQSLVERLRAYKHTLDDEAAYEIERLQSQLARVVAHAQERVESVNQLRAKDAEIERLNHMLRDTHGYGQGPIDAYVAQCEEIEQLTRERDEAREAARTYRESWCINTFHEVLPLTDSEPKWLISEAKAVAEPEEWEGEG